MGFNKALGIAGIAIIVIAAAYAGYLVMNDWGGDEGGSDEPVRLEYSLNVTGTSSTFDFDIHFYGSEPGYVHFYLGDDPLLNVEGEIMGYTWHEPQQVNRAWWHDLDGYSVDYVKDNLRAVFSSNLDPVRVDH